MKKSNGKNIEIYHRLSHELALKQLLERFIFELNANANILKNDEVLTLDDLINDLHNVEIFTDSEYKEIYEKSLEEFYNNIDY